MSSLSLDVLSDTVWFELGRQLGLKLECYNVSGRAWVFLVRASLSLEIWLQNVWPGVAQSVLECLVLGCSD